MCGTQQLEYGPSATHHFCSRVSGAALSRRHVPYYHPPGVQFDQNDLSVRLGDIPLMEGGQPLPFDAKVGLAAVLRL